MLFASLFVAACASAPTPTAAPSEPASGQPTAPLTTTEPADSHEPNGPSSATRGLIFTEVGFTPASGDHAFVEISNTSSTAIDVTSAILRVGTQDLALGSLTQPLAPGTQSVVLFDGLGTTEGTVLHAPIGFSLASDSGAIELRDQSGARLDRVAWGDTQPNAVALTDGALVPEVIAPGTTIGRASGATAPGQPGDWAVYAPAAASPGQPNPMPTIGVLLPLSGSVVDGAGATLSWYPVAGAASYRVQVSADPAFATTSVDTATTGPQVDTGPLAAGEYSWRVQAIGADGSASQFSEPNSLELGSPIALAIAAVAQPVDALVAADGAGAQLAVPLLSQHKDTQMLLLERNVEHGAHGWDNDHGSLDPADPSDNKNCALASVAMVNHFFTGDLSQDRIGYELYKDRVPGPERDLNYGSGIRVPDVTRALTFAFGAAPVHRGPGQTPDAVWSAVTASIDAGRPVVVAGVKHVFVFTGYGPTVAGGKRLLTVNDPWNYAGKGGTSRYDIDANGGKSAAILDTWELPAGAAGRRQEQSVTTDSDGDGLVDFDESERFHTNPNDPDGDGDQVRDKQDVAAGIFDPTYGYARDPQADGPGRDFDADGVPTERDGDSDAGGCVDGDEDEDFDGHRNGKETWNFDTSDDVCGDLVGTITWTLSSTLDGATAHSSSSDQVILNVRFDEEGGEWVDAGSSYTWTGSSKRDDDPGDDPEHGYCNEHHETTTTTGGGAFAGSLASSIYVSVDRDANMVFVSSLVTGLLQGHKEDGRTESGGGPTTYCVLIPSDYSQGGGTTIDSQAEWVQVPRCLNADESVDGTISVDGKTATFSCTNTVTSNPTEGYTKVTTMTVSGQLTFSAR